GKVPGTDQPDNAEGAPNRVGEGIARFAWEGPATDSKSFARVILQDVDALDNLATRLLENLALFTGHRAGDLFQAAACDLGRPPKDSPAFRRRGVPPIRPGPLSRLDSPLNILGRGGRELRYHVGRI